MRDSKILSFIFTLYLLLIGVGIGAMVMGALSAPIIFRAAHYVEGLDITLLQSGVLMTNIFFKLNILLNILAAFIVIYEIVQIIIAKDRIAPLFGFISVILIVLFSFYYTPYIAKAQNVGQSWIETLKFDQMHQQSELVFKALIVFLFLLFCSRVFRAFSSDCKGK